MHRSQRKTEEHAVDAYRCGLITTMCLYGHLFYSLRSLESQKLASLKLLQTAPRVRHINCPAERGLGSSSGLWACVFLRRLGLLLPLSSTCSLRWSTSLGTRPLRSDTHTHCGEKNFRDHISFCSKWSAFIFILVEGRAADCEFLFNLAWIIILYNWLLTRF